MARIVIFKKCKTCGELFTRQGNRGRGKSYCSYKCIRHSTKTRKKLSRLLIGNKRALGCKHSEESIDRARNKLLGIKASDETKELLSLRRKEEWKNEIRKSGWKHTEKTKNEMSERRKGKNNANWQGGISENLYPKEFNSELKLRIRKRDSFTCCLCKKTEREELEELNRVLCVNHINFNKDDCSKENLNTLCLRCNIRVNKGREYWTNYFQMSSIHENICA